MKHLVIVTMDEIIRMMSDMSDDVIAMYDYVLPTGEIVWEYGKRAETCEYHPTAQQRLCDQKMFDDRLLNDTEALLYELIDKFVVDCDLSDTENAHRIVDDLAEAFFAQLPYNTDIEDMLDYLNCDFEDDEDWLTRSDVRNLIAERLLSEYLP